jgi:hypothetical protein
MTGEGSEHSPKLDLLLGGDHESFKVSKPDDSSRLMGQNGKRGLDQVRQRCPGQVNPLGLPGHWDGVDRQHWSPQGPSL